MPKHYEYDSYGLARGFADGRPEELKAALEAQPSVIHAAGLVAAVLESARGISMTTYREISYQVQKWGGWY